MLKPRCRLNWGLCSLGIGAVVATSLIAQCACAAPIDEPVGYKLSICENLDVLKKPNDMKTAMMAAWTTPAELAQQRSQPYLCLENTNVGGTGDAQLKDFYMTIGDTANHFDWAKIIKLPSSVSAKIIGLDKKNGGKTSELVHIQFKNFEPGMKVYFQIDIDPDANLMQFGDYRTVLFQMNGGPNTSGNSVHRARFNDPSLPDGFEKFLTKYNAWENPVVNYPTSVGMEPRATYQMDHIQPFNSGNIGLQPVPEPSALALASAGLTAAVLCLRRRRRAA
jgi:hypothetical protein